MAEGTSQSPLAALAERLRNFYGERLSGLSLAFGELTVDVTRGELLEVVQHLHDAESFVSLTDVTAASTIPNAPTASTLSTTC
jgi:NADH:ubiquinone oxidoreductase subunit C